jgi:hypothetical protein
MVISVLIYYADVQNECNNNRHKVHAYKRMIHFSYTLTTTMIIC